MKVNKDATSGSIKARGIKYNSITQMMHPTRLNLGSQTKIPKLCIKNLSSGSRTKKNHL